jgi:pantoate--beta-alanine ligase
MEVVKTKRELQQLLGRFRHKALVGFVPTMGALHMGHLSLVSRAGIENEVVVVSIFVNPTQFNDKGDLEKYPRNLDSDLKLLLNTKCDIVFIPEVSEIYSGSFTSDFSFGHLENVMEGKYRSGHFNGVAQVVSILFDIVKPNKAYFGQKDFQQLTIIKALVKQLNLNIEIVSCEIVREKDGLAMSSRNMRLTSEQKVNSVIIFKTLKEAQNFVGNKTVEELKNWVVETVNNNKFLEVEYFEIVDNKKLLPVKSWDEKTTKVGCIAVLCGKIRLIDNIVF